MRVYNLFISTCEYGHVIISLAHLKILEHKLIANKPGSKIESIMLV